MVKNKVKESWDLLGNEGVKTGEEPLISMKGKVP